jgi:hypothetical protein
MCASKRDRDERLAGVDHLARERRPKPGDLHRLQPAQGKHVTVHCGGMDWSPPIVTKLMCVGQYKDGTIVGSFTIRDNPYYSSYDKGSQ